MLERAQVSDVYLINELWKEYAAALNAGDIERWSSLWQKDGIQMAPGFPRRVGRKLIQKEIRKAADLFERRITIYPEQIQVLGDQAFVHGAFDLVTVVKDDTETADVKGKFLTILQRQIDGIWKIAIECFNFDSSNS
jgi:uncharacterized protein (TIGR02246 family)